MCGPMMAAAAAASAALAVGSSMASRSAENDVYSAQSRAIKKSQQRDAALRAEAEGIFGNSLNRAQKPEQDARLNEAVTKRTQAYTKAVSPSTSVDLPGSKPSVIADETSRAVASADRSTTQQAGAKAKLDSFGDFTQGNAIANNRSGNLLQMLGNFRAGNRAILPFALQAAQRRGGGKRTLSDLLRAGSQVASSYGAAGAPLPDWFSSSVNPITGGDYLPGTVSTATGMFGHI